MWNGINEFDYEILGIFNIGNEMMRFIMKLLNVIGNESWYIDNIDNVNGNLEFLLDLKKYVFMYCVDFWIVFDVYFFLYCIDFF